MIYCIEADNGQLVGCCAAEIVSVPYYELIDQNLEKANRDVQIFPDVEWFLKTDGL